MNERIRALDKAIKEVAVPALESDGFKFDGKRTFRKINPATKTCQIIGFQAGKRSMAGHFTMNLAVYSRETSPGPKHPSLTEANESDCLPEFRERLGKLIKSKWTKFWESSLGPSGSAWWKEILYGTHDKWWTFTGDHHETAQSVHEAVDYVRTVGLAWLTASTDVERMQKSFLAIAQREGTGHNKSLKPTPPHGGAA